ncbi:MAG: PrsW family glutamic-type intramembrane protease [Alphaproteobacteria bacterium]
MVFWLSRSSAFERPGWPVWLAFCLGVLSVWAPSPQRWLIDLLPFEPSDQLRLFLPIYVFLIAAPIEEFAKLAALLVTLWSFSLHDRPVALVGCGLAVGVGFASGENYSFGLRHGYDEALARIDGFLLHAAFTGIAAIFLAFGKNRPEHRWRYWLLAIGVPVIIHGANNILLSARRWFDAFDPSDPLASALSDQALVLYGVPVFAVTTGIFVALFVQLRRKLMGDLENERRAWTMQDVWGVVLTTIGIMGMTKGIAALFLALRLILLANVLDSALALAAGLFVVSAALAILKLGWRRAVMQSDPSAAPGPATI